MKNKERTTEALAVATLVLFIAFVGTGAVTGVAAQDATVSPGDSIQDAINSASAGDTIAVGSGTYAEDIDVNVTDLTLEGPNAGTPGDGARSTEATIEGQVVLSENGTTLDGFEVSPPPAQTNQDGEAVRVSNTPDDVVVTNNIVRNFNESGVPPFEGIDGINIFGGDATDAVEDVEVTRNKVENIEGRNTDGGATGISIQGNVENATVEENVVSNIGLEETAFAFGIVVRGTGNHNVEPKNVGISNNDVSDVVSDPATQFFGVGLGVETDDASEVRANNNNIETPELLIQNKDTNNTLDATLNWWGDPSGPDRDRVIGDVEFVPWLNAPFPAGEPTLPRAVLRRTLSRGEVGDPPYESEIRGRGISRGEGDTERSRGRQTRRRDRSGRRSR